MLHFANEIKNGFYKNLVLDGDVNSSIAQSIMFLQGSNKIREVQVSDTTMMKVALQLATKKSLCWL